VVTRTRKLAWLVLLPLTTLALLGLALTYWLTHRSQPSPVQEKWFRGVSYERFVMRSPRPVVAHLVRVDLREPGIEVVVTPPEPSASGELRSRPTSAFASAFDAQVAINGSYFYPFRNDHPLDYEPHPGDPVHVLGLTASGGVAYGKPLRGEATLYVSRDNQVSFAPKEPVWNAISGMGFVVREGAPATFRVDEFTFVPYPRSIVAQDRSGRELMLLVIDGKQPGYSEGLTLLEAAQLLLAHGGHTGIQLDGGGSATLVREHARGSVREVSSPANFKIPGWERSVASHLGVRARSY
jgi:hypothetical protein